MKRPLARGDEILKILMEVSELDWARNSFSQITTRIKSEEISEDRSTEPPYTSFRFKTDQNEILKLINEALSSRKGPIEWTLSFHDRAPSPGINWTISPKIVAEKEIEAREMGMRVQDYFREKLPDFGPAAYQDMIDLAAHLRSALSFRKKKHH